MDIHCDTVDIQSTALSTWTLRLGPVRGGVVLPVVRGAGLVAEGLCIGRAVVRLAWIVAFHGKY